MASCCGLKEASAGTSARSPRKSVLEGRFPHQFCLLGFLALLIALTLKSIDAFDARSDFSESNSNNLPCWKLQLLEV